MRTPRGLRAPTNDKADHPAGVTRYLRGKFGEALPDVRVARARLARSLLAKDVAARAYALTRSSRPRSRQEPEAGAPRATSISRVSRGWIEDRAHTSSVMDFEKQTIISRH